MVGGPRNVPNHLSLFLVNATREDAMRTLLMTLAAASVATTAIPLMNGVASAQADVDVRVGPPGVKIEEPRRPDVVIEKPRRPGVVIEETEGRKRDCVTHSQSESSNGVTVTEKERDCR
jgi:hypothetical protein